ncbi:arginase family protein [Mesorhizobium sp. MSK_1335]|uniref:Arginase family protein n=1 Tax=Mesorhizobium montanum TaxID=3072323 RepID=A0ABU4ZMQ1_9HYPH|nr:arginase family protein [Mesorhizobium sp. MSK_1335]MDX8526665.1 arginase family protein [Mesorhizobium sp. MSK_1335]
MRDICLFRAPSNLGLRPLRPGHVPGTWRGPEALTKAGLVEALAPAAVVDLERPAYSTEPEPGTRLRNGHAIRRFNLVLADAVADALGRSEWPLVIGGDCSVLLGALAAARRSGPVALVHVDGHSDFRHPGNYDANAMLGSAAGMDLALATGRGELLLTGWPSVAGPLVADEAVVQIGERNSRDPDFAWADINATAIMRIDVFAVQELGAAGVLERTRPTLARADCPYWLHLDVDVLDQAVMPAVDSPGSPGIDPDDLVAILSPLAADRRCIGMDMTIYDPDLDPSGELARVLVSLLERIVRPGRINSLPPASPPLG